MDSGVYPITELGEPHPHILSFSLCCRGMRVNAFKLSFLGKKIEPTPFLKSWEIRLPTPTGRLDATEYEL